MLSNCSPSLPLSPSQSSLLTEGKFGSHKLEQIYREEQLKMINTLNDNLDKELSITASGINTGREKKRYILILLAIVNTLIYTYTQGLILSTGI